MSEMLNENLFESLEFEEDIIDNIVVDEVNDVEIVDQVEDEQDDFLAPPTVKQAKSNVPAGLDFNFDFGSLGIPGVISGDIGLEISRYPVDKLKFTTTGKSLINIVSPKVVAVKTHYIDGLGNIICNGKTCCDKDGAPRIKYVFPCVVYDTDKKGRPVSKTLDFKALAVGAETYESIMTKHELQGDISSVDLLVTTTDEVYQKIQLDVAGECRWRKNQAMIKEVSEFWAENMKDLLKAIARQVTDAEVKEALMVDNGPAEADIDFNDCFAD